MNNNQKLTEEASAVPLTFGSPSGSLSSAYPALRLDTASELLDLWRPPSDLVGLRASAPREGGTM